MNAQTLIAAAAFATAALTSADALACNSCDTSMIEAFATTDLSGSYIDLKPIGVVETDSAGFTSLKPIGYWATAADGSVELKPIGSEHQETYDFAWTVDPADVSSGFRELGEDLVGLKPIGIIETDSDGYLDVQQMGEINVDSSGYADLPARSTYSSTVDYRSIYTAQRLLSVDR
jgi:hypothetical protein